jgi:hypothetical protein
MKKRAWPCAIIIIESTIIVLLFLYNFLQRSQEFNFEIDDATKHTFTVSNSTLYLYIQLSENGSLQHIFITDGNGRELNLSYSSSGLKHYRITDETNGYGIESDFSEMAFSLEGIAIDMEGPEPPAIEYDDMIFRPVILRIERYGDIQEKYTVDYATKPYFFFMIKNEDKALPRFTAPVAAPP